MDFVWVLILTLINIVLWLVFFAKLRKTYSPKKILENIRVEVDKLLIEINRETDRDLTLIENKIALLKQMIEQADKRLGDFANLGDLSSLHDLSSLSDLSSLRDFSNETEKTKVLESANKQIAEIQNNINVSNYSNESKKAQKSYPVKKENIKKESTKKESAKKEYGTISLFPPEEDVVKEKPLKDQVIELYQSDIDVSLIADRLNVTIAEVQMIVNLYCK